MSTSTPTSPVAAAPAPARNVVNDVSEAIDMRVRANMARAWSGISPISLALAYTDWALHFASSPGARWRLFRQAMEQSVNWQNDAVLALAKTAAKPLQELAHAGRGEPEASPTAVAKPVEPLAQAIHTDPRYADPLWEEWPWRGCATASKAMEAWWRGASGLRGMQDHSREQMRFYGLKALDVLAPSNWLLSNPEAMRTAWETGGQSLMKGMDNAMNEFRLRHGGEGSELARSRRKEDPMPGQQVAVTPGRVVLRNRLIELIQYAPTTEQVHAEPVLIVPSCIMKYYILDLAPQNSMVRWLVSQGHTVYIISWKNPDAGDAHMGMDAYVRTGVLDALDHVHTATGQPVHLAGYCLGGTFAAMAAAALGGGDAHAASHRDGMASVSPLASLTLMAAETDFTEPGEMGVLIDEAQVNMLEGMMAQKGFLTGKQMSGSFQFLHSRELVWSSQTKRWLLGEDEITNDLMAWNADVTRLPAAMHSQYLRHCFLNNDLAEGHMPFEGQSLSLRDIRVPVFAVGTVKDHVAPWRSVYKIHRLVQGDVTFALTNGGHNAGIVSEPGHKGRYFQYLTTPHKAAWRTADEWQAAAPRQDGSWWTAWSAWMLAQGSGTQVPARTVSPDAGVCDAPGDYVMVRYGD